jgi:predicted restriction endonuclease
MVRAKDRQIVRITYAFRCGYCGLSETDIGATLTIDHYKPVSFGGTDDHSNLVYCCHACNEFKSDSWSEDEEGRLLHPLQDDFRLHITEDDEMRWVGITLRGAHHIETLHLNRQPLVAFRQRNQRFLQGQEQNEEMLRRLTKIEEDVADLHRLWRG